LGQGRLISHRAAHGYRSSDFAIVWDIVDALKLAVRRMLVARGEAAP